MNGSYNVYNNASIFREPSACSPGIFANELQNDDQGIVERPSNHVTVDIPQTPNTYPNKQSDADI